MNARSLLITVLLLGVFLAGIVLLMPYGHGGVSMLWVTLFFVAAMKWKERLLRKQAYGVEVTITEIGKNCVLTDYAGTRVWFRFSSRWPRKTAEKLGVGTAVQVWLRKPAGIMVTDTEIEPFEFRGLRSILRPRVLLLPNTFTDGYRLMLETWDDGRLMESPAGTSAPGTSAPGTSDGGAEALPTVQPESPPTPEYVPLDLNAMIDGPPPEESQPK